MLLLGFKPTMSAGERPQTYALDRAATGTGPSEEQNTEILLYIYRRYTVTFQTLVFHSYKIKN